MEIYVRLYGALRRYGPQENNPTGRITLKVSKGITVSAVADQLGFPCSWDGFTVVNGKTVSKGEVLELGDQVVFIPLISGG
jgi:sulfur carrier protein ThiS